MEKRSKSVVLRGVALRSDAVRRVRPAQKLHGTVSFEHRIGQVVNPGLIRRESDKHIFQPAVCAILSRASVKIVEQGSLRITGATRSDYTFHRGAQGARQVARSNDNGPFFSRSMAFHSARVRDLVSRGVSPSLMVYRFMRGVCCRCCVRGRDRGPLLSC